MSPLRSIALSDLRRSRWAISFADLCLLLLGFFVLLQANSGRERAVVRGIAEQFGAAPATSDALAARTLFVPGEAVLTEAGRRRLAVIGAAHVRSGEHLDIRSVGEDRGGGVYDGWDLAAARLGALTRALTGQGIARARMTIGGLDQSEKRAGGQMITIVYEAAPTR